MLGLIAGTEHSLVPAGGPTDCGPTPPGHLEKGGFGRSAALLGFEDEAAALVKIDEPGAGEACRVMEGNGAFKYVVVLEVIGGGGIGPGDFEEVAEFGEEESVICPLGSARVVPPLNERMCRHEELLRAMRV